MQKNYFLLIVLLSFAATAQIVNIPDATFKSKLLAYVPAIDTNADGEIQLSEAQAVTTLSLTTNNLAMTDASGIEAFTNLTSLTFENSNVTALDFTALTNLENLTVSINYKLLSLNLSGLTNLKHLNCYENFNANPANPSPIPMVLNLTGDSNLIDINCGMNNLAALDVTNMPQLLTLSCNINQLTALDLTGTNNLTYLNCSSNQLAALNVTSLTNLSTLYCSSNHIAALNVNMLGSLSLLSCGGNPLGSLNVTGMTSLTLLNCASAQLTTIDLSTLTNLTNLDCSFNPIGTIALSNLVQLTKLRCQANNLTAIDVSALTNLTDFNCNDNQLTALNIANQPSLANLSCGSNQLTTIDLSHNTLLRSCDLRANLFTSLDFGSIVNTPPFTKFYELSDNANLQYVYLKNSSSSNEIMVRHCYNLRYVCANENQMQITTYYIANSFNFDPNTPNVQINSYCTFTPGGTYNTIAGTVTFDADNNGCDAGDAHFRNVKIGINDGTLSGAAFTNTSGDYSFYTQSGTFTLTPVFENPYFTISPATANVNSPTVNSTTQTQNFCITPLGIHNDVELTLWTPFASPGFDETFILIYKNKGNQIQSGNINFTFDDAVLDFVWAEPMTTGQTTNNLNWDYLNLQPFESRSIAFKLNVNGPMETPPVNIGDVLHFTAAINPVTGDETPADNVTAFNTIVNGSFDPNNKVCLDGTNITPEQVGGYLHYVINFQNSGTAAAQNIVVKDIIDTAKFDMASLQLVGSSHPQITKISGNKVEFIFENINLPAEIIDEPGSHGYVAFKIKTKSNLVIGNSVQNKADIYFDYNFPIATNTATTIVALLANPDFENKSVSVFPNPVKDKLNITAKENITSVQLYDVQGRLIATAVENSSAVIFDLGKNTAGVYFVKVLTANGVKVEKVIKQ